MIDESVLGKLANNLTEMKFEKNIFGLKSSLPLHRDVTNDFFPYCQGKTGYCWLESMLQCLSLYKKKETGETFLFDDKYLMFFDKLEKANLFLENIISNISKDVIEKNNSYVLRNAMTDRGQWQMAVNLISKYGLALRNNVIDKIPPEKTMELNICISYLLRMGAYEIRKQYSIDRSIQNIHKIKDITIQKVFDTLVAFYGKQYEKVDLPTYENMNPNEFCKKTIKFPFNEFISVYPTENRLLIETEMCFDGNVCELDRNKFLGVSNEVFDQILESQIEYDGFCWCSGDFGKFYIKKLKVLDDSYFIDSGNLGNQKNMMKFNRTMALDYHFANLTHAFVMIKNNGDYYAYDSSFSEDEGAACWVSKSWLNKYLLQAVVRKKNLKELKIKKIQEFPWDFFGI